MRLTTEQRVKDLERQTVVLQDSLKIMHRMLKEQRDLINEYVTTTVVSAGQCSESNGGCGDAKYTFVCKKRLERIDKEIDKMRKLVENVRYGHKAG